MRTSRCKVCERRRPVARMSYWGGITLKCIDEMTCLAALNRKRMHAVKTLHGMHWWKGWVWGGKVNPW